MGEKIKTMECRECPNGPCITSAPHRTIIFECGIDGQVWIHSTDYEITKKKGNVPGIPEVPPFPCGQSEYKSATAELLKAAKKKTPNCAVCMWKKEEERYENAFGDKYVVMKHFMCEAQGLNDCDECYNTEECKALFEPMEGK